MARRTCGGDVRAHAYALGLYGIFVTLFAHRMVYMSMLWSFVFPLGMFALASGRLSLASDFTPPAAVAYTMVWIALLAWFLTASGLAVTLWRSLSTARFGARRAR